MPAEIREKDLIIEEGTLDDVTLVGPDFGRVNMKVKEYGLPVTYKCDPCRMPHLTRGQSVRLELEIKGWYSEARNIKVLETPSYQPQ